MVFEVSVLVYTMERRLDKMNGSSLTYKRRVSKYERLLEKYKNIASSLGNYKLITVLVGIAAALLLYNLDFYIVLTAQVVAFIVLFTFLNGVQNKIILKRNYCKAMLQINQQCYLRANSEWKRFLDNGEEYVNSEHSFSNDLDLFGPGSLFQMINMTATYSGRQHFSDMLVTPLRTEHEIYRRQDAIKELSHKQLFRHRLLAYALDINSATLFEEETTQRGKSKLLSGMLKNMDSVFEWAASKDSLYCAPWFRALIYALPCFTFVTFILGLLGISTLYIPLITLIVQFLMLGYKINIRSRSFELVEKNKNSLNTYTKLLLLIENEKFESDLLKDITGSFKNSKGKSASKQLAGLSKVWNMIADRYNMLHFVVNVITLWDYHCMVALEKWKAESGSSLKKWFDSIGEIEALSSLSILHHDNKDFIFPKVLKQNEEIFARELAHPLLSSDRKANDIIIGGKAPVILITGSNMSGKSTFLRTVGISMLLTYIGAPVCAVDFRCPILNIYACMKTSDNLSANISSFYAELLRVKMIVEAVDRGENVFFLLDEIFKGTNSMDRHLGAEALINQLISKGAWGMVSTHDLELGEMEKQSGGKILNYHFKEYYEDDKIFFDYKIRKGVSDTRNAAFLMKIAGVSFKKN